MKEFMRQRLKIGKKIEIILWVDDSVSLIEYEYVCSGCMTRSPMKLNP